MDSCKKGSKKLINSQEMIYKNQTESYTGNSLKRC